MEEYISFFLFWYFITSTVTYAYVTLGIQITLYVFHMKILLDALSFNAFCALPHRYGQ